MSHAATKWAFDQPELHHDMKPSEWAVLMVLADCHNPVNGCFPSQDYICSKTNLAERAVRDQLARLRDRGLINWDAARENGRRGSNRYQLAFEAGFQPANSAGSSTGKNAQVQPADSDTDNRQNLPPNPVREPVKEPEREGAREREEGEPDLETPEGLTKRAEALFFKSFKSWDRFDVSPKQPMLAAWGKLTWAQMEAAADAVPRFLAGKKAAGMRYAPAISTYLDLDERLWEAFPPVDATPARIAAPVFGPVWSAMRMRHLLAGPGPLPKASNFLESLMAQDDERGRGERLAHQARWGFPAVNAMHAAAERSGGWTAPPDDERLKALMEPVEVGSDRWQAWKDEHMRRGWPWVPDPGRLPVVWFPAGGPAGLGEFERAARDQEAGKHEQQAAE